MLLTQSIRIYRTNGANTKYGIRNYSGNIGEIGTTNNYSFRLIQNSGAALTIDTSKNATITGNLTVSGTGQSSFGGQVTIPRTPVAATDAASKGYVDSKFAGTDTLAEVLALGNTTGGTDIAVSANDDITFTNTSKAYFGGNDLQILHDGSDSFVQDFGTGDFYVRSYNSTLFLKVATTDSSSVWFNRNYC